MALELDENTFDQNYTNDNAIYQLRFSQYLPIENDKPLAFGEHQDYLGFTLLQNDDVPGMYISTNITNIFFIL